MPLLVKYARGGYWRLLGEHFTFLNMVISAYSELII